MSDAKIHVIHENDAWVEPLRDAFAARDLPYQEWFLADGRFDLGEAPPQGVFYNRMSASSHTRGHRYAAEYTGGVLAWLESHGRRVVNGGRALQLEISKIAQYTALAEHGIVTPRTLATVGRDNLIGAARGFDGPFITKHNRAGKGLGVRLFHDVDALESYVDGPEFEHPIDGVTLVQQYIEAPEPFITRAEFVGGRFLYAVRVDTSQGFELCPADACRIDEQTCPVGEKPAGLFTIVDGFQSPLIERYERFLSANGIEIAGIEFILDQHGNPYTYDINTNTNYNPEAETAAGTPSRGMGAIADFLCRELARVSGVPFPCAQVAA